MTRTFAALVLCGLAMGVAAFVIYRENSPRSPVQAAFYQDLAQADAVVDPAAAQSMISGYRSNNGLGRVVIDADLMRLASEQARAMAARGRMDQEVGSPFQDRMRKVAWAAVGSRTLVLATTRSPMRFPAGAIRRRFAPICSIAASPAWGSRRPMHRLRSTRCSGR